MLRLNIALEEDRWYWTITRHGEIICAGLNGFATREEADADARDKWNEYTGK